MNTHDDAPPWASYFDETKLIVDAGIAHGRMEEYAAASRLIEDALQVEDQRHSRPRAFHASALMLSLNLGSARTLSHIRDFRDQLAPYRAEKVVHEFERSVLSLPDLR